MTADLRRLAEQAHRESWDYWDMASWDYGGGDQAGMMRPAPFTEPENAAYIAAANPKAILDVLDKVENLQWNHEILHEANGAYERRVAALEEGLRDLWECWDTGQDDDVLDVHFQAARALLASDRRRYGSLLCPDCGHHLHRPNPGICQWYDCGCPAETAAPAGLDRGALEQACIAVVGPWFDESHERGAFRPMELAQRILRDYDARLLHGQPTEDGNE